MGGVYVIGIGSQIGDEGFKAFQNARNFLNNPMNEIYSLKEIANDNEDMSYEFMEEHKEEFHQVFEMLADDLSKEFFVAYLKGMCSGAAYAYYEKADCSPYFNGLTQSFLGGTLVDCGAFTGDTLESFIECSHGIYDTVYAIEAEPDNAKDLESFVAGRGYRNIRVIQKAVGSFAGKISFESKENKATSRISENGTGNIEIEMDTIDHIVGDDKVTFIKMDIEGNEQEALKGAKSVIEVNMPVLAICVYHRKNDLIVIPPLLCGLHSKGIHYKLYLRKHTDFFTNSELVLYAIPVKD